jgi:hypothetical protein
MTSRDEAFRNQVWTVLNDLTECIAQLGEALSVHLPDADIDIVASRLSQTNNRLNVIERMIND